MPSNNNIFNLRNVDTSDRLKEQSLGREFPCESVLGIRAYGCNLYLDGLRRSGGSREIVLGEIRFLFDRTPRPSDEFQSDLRRVIYMREGVRIAAQDTNDTATLEYVSDRIVALAGVPSSYEFH